MFENETSEHLNILETPKQILLLLLGGFFFNFDFLNLLKINLRNLIHCLLMHKNGNNERYTEGLSCRDTRRDTEDIYRRYFCLFSARIGLN